MAAVVPARAVLLVTLNILRVLCRKYGLYLALGLTLVLLQGYSGYQGLRRAREEPQEGELGRALPSEDASVSASACAIYQGFDNSLFYSKLDSSRVHQE